MCKGTAGAELGNGRAAGWPPMLPVILGEHKTSAAYKAFAFFFRHKQMLKTFPKL